MCLLADVCRGTVSQDWQPPCLRVPLTTQNYWRGHSTLLCRMKGSVGAWVNSIVPSKLAYWAPKQECNWITYIITVADEMPCGGDGSALRNIHYEGVVTLLPFVMLCGGEVQFQRKWIANAFCCSSWSGLHFAVFSAMCIALVSGIWHT
jgi:hypothetical protein